MTKRHDIAFDLSAKEQMARIRHLQAIISERERSDQTLPLRIVIIAVSATILLMGAGAALAAFILA